MFGRYLPDIYGLSNSLDLGHLTFGYVLNVWKCPWISWLPQLCFLLALYIFQVYAHESKAMSHRPTTEVQHTRFYRPEMHNLLGLGMQCIIVSAHEGRRQNYEL